MQPLAFYETTIADRDAGYAIRVVNVPVGALPEANEQSGISASNWFEDWVAALGLETRFAVDVGKLPTAIAATLRHPFDAKNAEYEVARTEFDWTQDLHEFSEYVAYAPVVAAEASPLAGQAIASLAAKGHVSAGAVLALVAFGDTPLVFVAAPAGIILLGAAAGIGSALEQGLRRAVLSRLGVDEEQNAETGVGV